MYTLSRNLHITTGITFFVAFIIKFSCSLFASYSLGRPHDRVAQPPSVNAEEVTTSLRELNSYQAFNKHFPNSSPAVEQIERELIEKLRRGALSLPAIFAEMSALIEDNQTQTPEYTALMRVYQAAVLQQAINDPTKKSDVDLIISFIKAGADVTKVDTEDKNALHRAAEKGHEAAVRFLVPFFKEKDLLDARQNRGRTALHYAAYSGNIECIKALLDAGATFTAIDKDGYNALHRAAWEGREAAVQLLVPLFAKSGLIDAVTLEKKTALHTAAYGGNIDIKIFLDAGASLTAVDKYGHNALHIAAEKGHEVAVQFLIPLFIKSGLLDAREIGGRTALHFAAESGNFECIKALLDAGANLTAADDDKRNILHYAARWGRTTAVQFLTPLFAKNGLIDASADWEQTTALHNAAQSGNIECIKTLLDAGATLTATDKNGSHALHHAAYWGNAEVTLFLVPLFAKNNLLEVLGYGRETPLERAQQGGNPKIVALLWILGAKRPLSKKELPAAVQEAIYTVQTLTPEEFDGLIAALGALHEMNIRVPASLMRPFSSGQELFSPLREAILKRLRPIQQNIRDGLPSLSLVPEIENIVEEYLIGKVPRPQLSSSSSSSSSSSNSCQIQ